MVGLACVALPRNTTPPMACDLRLINPAGRDPTYQVSNHHAFPSHPLPWGACVELRESSCRARSCGAIRTASKVLLLDSLATGPSVGHVSHWWLTGFPSGDIM